MSLKVPMVIGEKCAYFINCALNMAFNYWCIQGMARIRKSTVQIRFEILEYLFFNSKPSLRTVIWRKSTNLSYDDFLKHLLFLEEKKLVKESSEGTCTLTEEGRKLYIDLRKSLPSIL